MLKIYNNVTRKKEKFKTLEKNKVKMYVCGPTVYDDIHIGNARPLIFFDFVYRSLVKLKYQVEYVSNITDIDDKIIKRARQNKISEEKYADEQIMKYFAVLEKIGVANFEKQPRVTEYMDDIIKYIQNLLDLGYAYKSPDGDIYFRVSKIEEYGKLSGRKIDELITGSRVKANLNKEEETDFALWKHTSEGVFWKADFGCGRPGWHTECAVIINETLGEKIDIHGGGIDLRFPHHENENAQNKATNNLDLANYWMYNGFVNLNNEKMSKSLNNFITVTNILEKYDANFLKLLLLQTGYRQPINITEEFIEQTNILYTKIKKFLQSNNLNLENNFELHEKIKKIIENDFNTPNLISLLLENLKTNKDIVYQILYLLGIDTKVMIDEQLPANVLELIKKRDFAKKEKNFPLSDKIREQLEELDYQVLDTKEGTKVEKK